MSEIKLSVSITIPGRVMFSEAEVKAIEGEKKSAGFDLNRVYVTGKKGTKDILNVLTRKTRHAKQSINMYKEAYDYMISKDSCPPDIRQTVWDKMNSKQRLEDHLERICKSLEGISYTYKVFND